MIRFLNKGRSTNYNDTLTPEEYIEAVTKTEDILKNMGKLDTRATVIANEYYYGNTPNKTFKYTINKKGVLHINAGGWLTNLSISASNGYTGEIIKFDNYAKFCVSSIDVNEGDTITLNTSGGYNSMYTFVIYID